MADTPIEERMTPERVADWLERLAICVRSPVLGDDPVPAEALEIGASELRAVLAGAAALASSLVDARVEALGHKQKLGVAEAEVARLREAIQLAIKTGQTAGPSWTGTWNILHKALAPKEPTNG